MNRMIIECRSTRYVCCLSCLLCPEPNQLRTASSSCQESTRHPLARMRSFSERLAAPDRGDLQGQSKTAISADVADSGSGQHEP